MAVEVERLERSWSERPGLVTWLVCSVSGPAQFIPLGLFSHALWWKMGAVHLVTTLAATLAGAAIYRERPAT